MEESEPKAAASPVEPEAATALPSDSDSGGWLGRVLDERYRVLRMLGEGGMGAVFVAEHLTLRKEVALKVIRAELAGNGEVATRFAREAMATAQFEHPHVASAIDFGTLPEGGAYFVMQLVRGKSLRALLAHQEHDRLAWRRACDLLAQVADALSAAKAKDIVHRDLKPDNILVEAREDGSELVKVLDFGIARVAPRDAPAPSGAHVSRELTRVGTVMGTPGYMAPEQAVGDRVDHRADLYALGVVLWECIAGRALWFGVDLTAVVTKQMVEPVPRLATFDPSVPLELDELVQKLTARMPQDRPDSSGDVRDALRKLALTPETRGSLERLSQGVAWVRAVSVDAEHKFRSLPPPQQKRTLGVAALGLLALASAGFLWPRSAQPHALTGSQAIASKAAAEQEKIDAQKDESEVPEELQGNLSSLLNGKSVRERRDAAQALLSYGAQDRIAEPIKMLAAFEAATGCKPRRDAIDAMLAKPDPRFLPGIRKRNDAPRSGCGFLRFEDCYSCNRSDLKRAVDQLEELYPEKLPADGEALNTATD